MPGIREKLDVAIEFFDQAEDHAERGDFEEAAKLFVWCATELFNASKERVTSLELKKEVENIEGISRRVLELEFGIFALRSRVAKFADKVYNTIKVAGKSRKKSKLRPGSKEILKIARDGILKAHELYMVGSFATASALAFSSAKKYVNVLLHFENFPRTPDYGFGEAVTLYSYCGNDILEKIREPFVWMYFYEQGSPSAVQRKITREGAKQSLVDVTQISNYVMEQIEGPELSKLNLF